MNIDANEVIDVLRKKLSDKEMEITVLEIQVRKLSEQVPDQEDVVAASVSDDEKQVDDD